MTFSEIMSYLWQLAYDLMNIAIPLGELRPTFFQLAIGFLFFSIVLHFIFSFIRGRGD